MSDLDSRHTKKSTELTLIDKLSRLSYSQTLKLLGSDGPRLLRAGDKWEFRMEEDVYLGEDLQVSVEVEGRLALTVNLKASDTDKELAPGAAVTLWIAPTDVRVLPAEREAS